MSREENNTENEKDNDLGSFRPSKSSYSDREGYSNTFLGDTFELPTNNEILENAVVVNEHAENMEERYFLKYQNFSIMMNKNRRLAFYTACNIEGSTLKNSNDGISKNQKWRFDPRINEKYQIGNEPYEDNPLDRGHLVKRLDPVWGNLVKAKKANKDTFHYTNCCPQHEDLNRKLWKELENCILKNADIHDLKLTLFTGPVFKDNDREYNNIKIPSEFWKIVLMCFKNENNYSATAYLLSQKNFIDTLKMFTPEEAKTYQVPISRIIELTNINFGNLINYDPMGKIKILGTGNFRIIKKITDIIL